MAHAATYSGGFSLLLEHSPVGHLSTLASFFDVRTLTAYANTHDPDEICHSRDAGRQLLQAQNEDGGEQQTLTRFVKADSVLLILETDRFRDEERAKRS